MKSRRKYHAALSAEYALGTLRGPARLQFEKQMQEDLELAAEVARWQEAFSQLDNTLTPVVPPASVWKRIQLQLLPKPATIESVSSANASQWRSINKAYIGWAVAACLAAVLVVPRLWVTSSLKAPQMTPVAILANASAAPTVGQWVVTADNNTQQLTVTPLHAADIASDRSLELWVIPTGGKPLSLGLVNSDAPTQLALINKRVDGGSTLAISLEPKGGSPTGQPTGVVLYSGLIIL